MTENIEATKEKPAFLKFFLHSILLPFGIPVLFIALSYPMFFSGGVMPARVDEVVTDELLTWSIASYFGEIIHLAYLIYLVPAITQIALFLCKKKKRKVIYLESIYAVLTFVFTFVVALLRLHPFQL